MSTPDQPTQRFRPRVNPVTKPADATRIPQPGGQPLDRTPSPAASMPHLALLPQIPGYEILDEVGRGGMGIVYRATQLQLKRTVAIKMLPQGAAIDAIDAARFCSEAEIVAAIQHPNVVQVFEFSKDQARPYLVMEYLPGGTLAEFLAEPMSTTDSAALVELLARAVQAAHDQGIVHRDLKPGNVLFDAEGQPRVTDFGLAKRAASDLTRTQTVMGTPAYMAPEQASGRTKFAGPAADIYALGAILYECLTRDPPFGRDGESWEILHRVLHDPIVSPRVKNAAVPADLEWICLRCLEKEPRYRYPTAAALADDLLRFLRGEPVSVRPPGRLERAARWAKRRPSAAAAYAFGTLALALLVVGSVIATLWWRAVESQRSTESANAVISEEKANAVVARTDAETSRDRLSVALAGETKAREQLDQARTALIATKYFHDVSLAYREMGERNAARAARLLDQCPPDRRGWEWRFVDRTLRPEIARYNLHEAHRFAFSDGGATVTLIDYARKVRKAETTTGRPVEDARSPKLAMDAGPAAEYAYSADGRQILETLSNPDIPLDPDRKSFQKFGTARLWDVATGKLLRRWNDFDGLIQSGCLSQDGSTALITGHGDGRAEAIDLKTGQRLAKLPIPAFSNESSISKDGSRALTATLTTDRIEQFVVWNPKTGAVEHTLDTYGRETARTFSIGMLAPDGRTVAFVTRGGHVGFWPVGPDRAIPFQEGIHTGQQFQIAFSPDSSLCATAGEGGGVRVWRVKTGESLAHLQGHARGIKQLAFHPDNARLIAMDQNNDCILWNVNDAGTVGVFAKPQPSPFPLAVDDTASRMAISHVEGSELGILERSSKQLTRSKEVPKGHVINLQYLAGGKVLAQATAGGTVEFRDGKTGLRLRTVDVPNIQGVGPYYSRDGRRMLTVQGDKPNYAAPGCTAVVWDLETGQKLVSVKSNLPMAGVLSGDGRRFALGLTHGAVNVYDVTTGKQFATIPGSFVRDSRTRAMAMDERGTMVADNRDTWQIFVTALPEKVGDHPVRLEPFAVLTAHSATVTALAFAPEGDRLVSGSENGDLKIWDPRTGLEALGLKLPRPEPVHRVAFTADGQRLVALGLQTGAVIFDGTPRR